MGFSPELKTEFQRIKSTHQFKIPEEDQKAFIEISFDIKEGSPDDIVKQLDEFFTNTPPDIKERVSYVSEGNRVSFSMSPPLNIEGHIDPFKDMIGKI